MNAATERRESRPASRLAAGSLGSCPPGGEITVPHRLVRVRAANAGAGASTVALALADAADAGGMRTHLLDAAGPVWSGLGAASEVELGAEEGWRRGRRGARTVIDRVERHIPGPDQVPPARTVPDSDLVVIDAGWTSRELDGASGWVAATPVDAELVVARAGALPLGQTEAVLARLDQAGGLGRVLVVVTHASRRPGAAYAAAGPLFRALDDAGAVFFAPRRRSGWGIGPDPSPRPLQALGRSLLRAIATGSTGAGRRTEPEGNKAR